MTAAAASGAPRLQLLSYNIHIASKPEHTGHYFSRAWRHALPGPGMHETLDHIASAIRDHDFVALQEADAGSLRTRFVNQLEYLADHAGYTHVGYTITRDLKPFARHALGFVSRHAPVRIEEHALPGTIPGRRAMVVELGREAGGLTLLITHLSLGRFDRERQLDYLGALIGPGAPTVLIGDLNCDAGRLRAHAGLARGGLWIPHETPPTFPSWRPRWALDHILVTKDVEVHRVASLPHRHSDHLPLVAEVSVAMR